MTTQEHSKSSVLKVSSLVKEGRINRYELSNGMTLNKDLVTKEITITGKNNGSVELPEFGDPQNDFNFLYPLTGEFRNFQLSEWSNNNKLQDVVESNLKKSKLLWDVTRLFLVIVFICFCFLLININSVYSWYVNILKYITGVS